MPFDEHRRRIVLLYSKHWREPGRVPGNFARYFVFHIGACYFAKFAAPGFAKAGNCKIQKCYHVTSNFALLCPYTYVF